MARRGRKPNEPRALVAAATRIRLSDRRLAKKQGARQQQWQEDGWEYFDVFGFVKQALWLLGNSISKVRIYPAVANPKDPDGEPIPVDDPSSGVPASIAQQCKDETARLKGPLGGLSEILRELDMNIEVAGEGYVIGLGAREEQTDSRGNITQAASPEVWGVRSTSEVDITGDGEYRIRDDPNTSARSGFKLDPDLDTAIRFWLPHPRFSNLADSSMRGVLDDLETLLILTRQRRAEGKSRLASGLLMIDSNVTVASPVVSEQDDGENSGTGDVVLDAIVDAIGDAIEDESSAAGIAPVTIRATVPPNSRVADMVAKIDLSRTSDQWLDNRIMSLVESVARGMNLPVETVMGHQQTTFANADQIDEDKFYDHIEPRVLLIVDLLTVAFLRPQLTGEDADGNAAPTENTEWADRIFYWYDASALLSKADPSETADEAFDRFAISWAAYRGAKGYSEDDAPNPDEILVRATIARLAARMSPDLTMALMELLEPIEVTPGQAGDVSGTPPTTASAKALIAAFTEPQTAISPPTHHNGNGHVPKALARSASSNIGRRLMDIDRELRTRLLAAASTAMDRAMERAGNRVKAKMPETRTLTKRVDARQITATLGRTIVSAVFTDTDLIGESFDDLEAQFMAWGSTAQTQALELASQYGTGFSVAQRDIYKLRQAEDLVEAWSWLKEQLVTLATRRLYDPSPDVPLGEFDPNLSVPPNMIRQAITRAGGTVGVETMGGDDAWVVLADGGTAGAGGIGGGQLIGDALTAAGGVVEAFEWVYGPGYRQHPYEEHEALDGTVVENFDADRWDASASWTAFGFYFPGDHAGCLCDVAPVYSASDNL